MSGSYRYFVSHPLRNGAVDPWVRALEQEGSLEAVCTSMDTRAFPWLRPVFGQGPFESRQWSIPREKVKQNILPDPLGKLAMKLGARAPGRGGYEITALLHDRITAHRIPLDCDVVYGYEDSALQTFRTAKRMGKTTVLELSAGHWKEVQRRSQQAVNKGGQAFFKEPMWKIRRKQDEIDLADILVGPSEYAAEMIKEFEPHKTVLALPHVFPESEKNHDKKRESGSHFLYVGQLSIRKGTDLLLSAWRRVQKINSDAMLSIVGNDVEGYVGGPLWHESIEYTPYASRSEVFEKMRLADCFVFPSRCDGYGLVLAEAMTQGTPVLASAYCGARGVVHSGIDGWVYENEEEFEAQWAALCADPATLDEARVHLPDLVQQWQFGQRAKVMVNQVDNCVQKIKARAQ